MLTLILGRDWTANREEILHLIAEDVRQKQPGRILMVPEFISHDTERRLCMAAGDTASRYAQVLTFTRLASRVCDLVGSAAVECLDNGGRLVAMASATRQLHSRLKAYAAVETKPEFLAELVDAVDEFKRCCITSEDLKEIAGQTEGALSQKLEELSLILESYDTLCSRGKRDPRDQMTWVLEQLEDIDFAQEHVVYVDGFPDFTRQNLAILEHFIRYSPSVTIGLNCDVPGSHDLAFEKAGATAKELIECAHRAGVEVHIRTIQEKETVLQPVRSGLFQGKTEFHPELTEHVRILKAASLYQECQAAAEEIMNLIRSGCRYRDIALVCTDLNAYAPMLRLVFRKCGIPIYLSGTEDILQSGVVATVLAALDTALGGFEQRDVFRYLRSALSPLSADACDLVENYGVIWGISGKRWKEEWKAHPRGLSGQWDEASRQEMAELNAARSCVIDPLVRLSDGFRNATNLRQQVICLYAFLDEIQFAQRISALAETMDAEGDNRSAQILNQLWEILLNALEQLHDVLGETCWDLESFTRLLKLLLSQYDVGTIPPVLDSVTVGAPNAMRCQQQKCLVLLGANEGNLPGYGGSTGLLNDQERVLLRSLGLTLTGGAVDGLQEEFTEIYGVFCGAEEKIILSCCSSQPSFIYRRLADMTGGEVQACPNPAAIISDAVSAGAYLAKWEREDVARMLGVEDAYRDTLRRKRYALGVVQPEQIRGLYGRQLNLSASQIDQQAECRLAYFLRYGIRAQERKEATVDQAEFGTYVHAVLEATARDVMALGGFRTVDLDQTLSIAMAHSEEYTQEHFSQLESQRLQYLFRRNARELEMVVKELWRELHESAYLPEKFELGFGDSSEMPSIPIPAGKMAAVLRGYVDRVDIWKRGESTYYRVVDYKTGKKDFDYCDIFNGVGLQMLLYLFALEDAGESVIEGKRVPAGVQYFPARAPYVTADGSLTEEEAAKERKSLWKRKGLLLADEDSLTAMDPTDKMDILCCTRKKDGTLSGDVADRVQMGKLKKYVMAFLGEMVDEIASGNVEPNPYTRGPNNDACTYCPYKAICHSETVEARRNYKTMTAQRFWEEIDKEEKTNV